MKTIIIMLLTLLALTSCTAQQELIKKPVNTTVKEDKRTIKVTSTSVKSFWTWENRRDKYIVFTTSWTYEITDSLMNMRFNSSDLFGKIESWKCYEVTIDALSFRSWLLSSFENILEANEVECKIN